MSILIKNGHVIDIETNLDEITNVLIDKNKIIGIGKNLDEADIIIDASNCYVTAGFIDLHMHEQGYEELYSGIMLDALYQGVTTVIGGNCGGNHQDPIEYLDYIHQHGSPVNMGLLAGHGYFRNKAGATNKYQKITNEQLLSTKQYIHDALKNGCLGISYGIRYFPGADQNELLEVAKECIPEHKILTAHVRDDAAYIIPSLKEFIDLGKELDLPVEVSHIGSMGGFGQMKECLDLIKGYRNQGCDVHADCYPYSAFSTEIGETTYDDGFLERYQCDYSAIELSNGKYKGQRCTKEIFDELRKEAPDTITVAYVMKDEEVELALKDEFVMLASDGLKDHGQGHPRAAGSFTRLISEYVKKRGMDFKDAIHKMTLMPANKMNLSNKGRIQVGKDADLVIFNYDTIQDTATFEQPNNRPKGIEYVIVNGHIAMKQNQVINDHLGKDIRG